MQIKGIVHSIGETIKVSDKFKKRDFVIQIPSEYPQFIAMQLSQAKCEDIGNKLVVGTEIECSINLRGRLWTDSEGVEKCFNTLDVWRVTTGEAKVTEPLNGTVNNDLPF